MIVSVGKFTLKKLTLLPEFLKLSKLVYTQALESQGNITSKIENEGVKIFYSFTVWKTMEAMMHFVHTDHHQQALEKTEKLCKEACFTHFKTDKNIDFNTAKKRLKDSTNVRFLKFD